MAPDNSPGGGKVVVAAAPAAPPASQVQTEQPDRYQLRELTAQEVMADASVWMAVAAALTLIVTTLGTALIWRQVRLTRKAVEDTSAATEAMKEANRIAEDSSHRQLRAYLAVKSVTISESDWKEDHLQVMLEIDNAGQTPAVLRTVTMRVSWAHDGGDVTLIDHTSNNEVPCHRDTPMHIPFVFEAQDDALESEGHLMVVGRVEYDDAFGKRQKEPFSFRTDAGQFCSLWDHEFPIRLSAFSPLAILESIEKFEMKQKLKPTEAGFAGAGTAEG